jgi:hypothetical protein
MQDKSALGISKDQAERVKGKREIICVRTYLAVNTQDVWTK